MFFQGTLQEGISTALQQSKQVVCFVADDADESQQWESEFLTEDTVKQLLRSQAVTLRLQAGSEEAGYLEALFPVPRKPTIVVIQNGQLKEYIAAGTTRDEFLRRLGQALTVPVSPAAAPAPNPVVQETPGQDPQASAHIQSLLAERAARLEADKRAKEKAAKAEAKKKADERRAAEEEAAAGTGSGSKSAESNYAALLRKRKQDEKDERQRILKRIEDDKRERREREAQEKQARLLSTVSPDEDESTVATSTSAVLRRQERQRQQESAQLHSRAGTGGATTHCSLQVRLLDGSTIRNRFQSGAKVGTEVREWIDQSRTDGDEPYTFRVVLTPLPNKAIEPSEEADSLLDLGLAPSATLVLVPQVRVATAFQQTGGALFRAWSTVWALLVTLLSFPLTLFGGNRSGGEHGGRGVHLDNLDGQGSADHGQDPRIRGFHNPDDRRRDQQLYNGNSLNFEPRNDNDGEEEDRN